MANTFYAKKYKTPSEFVPELARFLINDLAGETGPGWTAVKVYSSAAGTPHEIPADGTDMDSLAADNGWRTGTIAVGDYIVLESASASNKFRVGIELQATTVVRIILDYRAGFDTGANQADMTNAANWTTTDSGAQDINPGSSAKAFWSVIADEDGFVIIYDGGTVADLGFMYCGKYNARFSSDEYNSVIFNGTYAFEPTCSTAAGFGAARTAGWYKLSAVDDSTLLDGPGMVPYMTSVSAFDVTTTDIHTLNGELATVDLEICCYDQGVHDGIFGTLPLMKIGNRNMMGTGIATFGDEQFIAINENSTYGCLVFPWDGVTPY